MTYQNRSAIREVMLSSPDLVAHAVTRMQARIADYVTEFRADVADIEALLQQWQPLPRGAQHLVNRMERLKPTLETVLRQTQAAAERATHSATALKQVEKALAWYARHPDAQPLLKQTLQDCRHEGAMLGAERKELKDITAADEAFFAAYLREDRPALTVYRGDGRGVNAKSLQNYVPTAILAGGRTDISFFGVIQHLESSTNKNGMVSTTKDRSQALDWALDKSKYGLVYTLRVSHYIDTLALLRERNFKHRFPQQMEVLVPHQIPAAEILSVELFDSNRVRIRHV